MRPLMDLFAARLIGRLRGTPVPRRVRLLEAVGATAEPALVRGGAAGAGTATSGGDDDADATKCSNCQGSGTVAGGICPRCEASGNEPGAMRESVMLDPQMGAPLKQLREAAAAGGPIYEVELLAEGPSKTSGVFYTKQALREAVANNIFEGMHAYAMHPRRGTPEDREPGNRDLRQQVGYYRNVRFLESGSLGKPTVAAELVLNKGTGWFTDLLESAVAARKDGVQLCGISIDAEGYVEPGEVGGRRYNLCRAITSAPSADVVSEAAAGGTIVRRLRESVARTRPPKPKEAPMKFADYTSKVEAAHVRLREATTKLTTEGAEDEDVRAAIVALGETDRELQALREATVEPEQVEVEKIVEKIVPGDGDNAELEAKLATTETQLREAVTARETAERERDEKDTELTTTKRGVLAYRVLREAKIPTDTATGAHLFNELVGLDGETAMKARVDSEQKYREELLTQLRESAGIGAPLGVEGAGALIPVGAPPAGGGADRLAEAGIPLTPEPSSN